MNLWLSPHGIWYYRKVTILPCGRRKEIKKFLHTRDKLCARKKVAKLFAYLYAFQTQAHAVACRRQCGPR
ncbi:hypothetical protein ABR850_10150 [Aeromonas veronii]|uniref:hypothetical protein n=1 Tax=Aeromonas veronii TaxID=654 RepID=UPI003305D189